MAEENKAAAQQQSSQDAPEAAYDGESNTNYSDGGGEELYAQVHEIDPAEEAELQRAEAFPRSYDVQVFDGHDRKLSLRKGFGATRQSELGRLVVIDEEVEHDGDVFKPGVVDLPAKVADALIDKGVAFEPAGKGKGR